MHSDTRLSCRGLLRVFAVLAVMAFAAPRGEAATPLTGATSVSAGGSHACAVVNGGVKCWGTNDVFQLGVDSVDESLVAIDVEGLPAGSGVTAVSAGYEHTCAIVDGGVRCWGRNAEGQLGRWTGLHTHEALEVPALPAGSGVTAIASGQFFTCAVAGGGVQCWGETYSGGIVYGDTPVAVVPPSSGATDVDAGYSHACAVVDGGVQCWGWNAAGQLGDGTTFDSGAPVVALPAGSGVTKVAVGADHTCATAGANVLCWGSNSVGQLGTGTIAAPPMSATALPVSGLIEPPSDISAGEGHTCVVIDGGVTCWGFNLWGGLGAGTTGLGSDSASPVQVVGLAAGSGATGVGARMYYSCAVVNGGVQCWGINFFRTLGNGSDDDLSAVPVAVVVDDPAVNTAPVVGPVAFAPSAVVPVNTAVMASAGVSDPDAGDSLACTVAWGDGRSDAAVPVNGACAVSQLYAAPGVYLVTIAATDAAGASASSAAYLAVYDPAAGFVTGGGWFLSSAGAYAADPSLTGHASFGFNARYRKGKSQPEGQTEFHFSAAGLVFKSAAYEWLVIGGHKASFRGTGALNGTGGYAFQLTAMDGDLQGKTADRIRVRIWAATSGAVVYDNQTCGAADLGADACTALGGGAIVIHEGK